MKTENPYLEVPSFPEDTTIDLVSLLDAKDSPIELEIGFGKGHFLLERSRAVPLARVIGIETRRKWVHLVQSRITKHHVENAVVYYGNAREIFMRLGPDASVDRIFIHFPDPWWKARHEKRMVVCPELLQESVRLLRDNGELFVQTDVDFRADKYQAILMANEMLQPATETGFVDENRYEARSLREKKCAEAGLPVYRLLFRRIARPKA